MAKKDNDKIIADQAKEIAKLKAENLKLQSKSEEYSDKALELSERAVRVEEELVRLSKQKGELSKQINQLVSEEQTLRDNGLDAFADQVKLTIERTKAQKESITNERALAKEIQGKIKAEQRVLELKEQQQKFAEKYSETLMGQLGFIDKISDAIEEIPVIGSFLSEKLGLEDVKKELSEKMLSGFKAGLQDAEGASGGIMAGLKGAAGSARAILASMGPLLPIALALGAAFVAIENALELDEELVTLANNLEVSKHSAHEIHLTAIDIASEMNVIGVNSAEVVKTIEAMKTTMGYNLGIMAEHNMAAKDLLATTTLLIEKQGLSAEEAVAFNKAAVATGVPLENLTLMSKSMGDELMSGREIMQEIGKVSKAVLINFSKNPKELVKAVKQAKLLGTTLDKINASGDSLLEIDSSIQKEMEARVLTGKDLNLNQARYYALVGDTAKLQEEITNQIGSAAEYEKMMPMQRKALAEAMGMTKDDLDEMMIKQKELESLGYTQIELQEKLALKGGDRIKELERLRKLNKGEAADMLAAKYAEEDRVKVMQRLTDVMSKLGDLAAKFLGPVLTMVDALISGVTSIIQPFERIASYINSILTGGMSFKDVLVEMGPTLSAITAAVTTIGTVWTVMILPSIIASARTMAGELLMSLARAVGYYGAMAISAIASASATTLGVGALAIAAGIATGVAAYKAAQVEDGAIDPNGGLVVSKPMGGIVAQGIREDNVVFTTNDVNAPSSAAGPDPNLAELVSLMKQLIASVNQPTVIKMGSRTIEELDSQISLRKNINLAADSSYGTRI